MKCDRCTNEATVHEVTIKSGKRHEKHLCEQCATGAGVAVSPHTPLTELLSQFVSLQAAAKEAKGKAIAATGDMCPACGMTFTAFRQHEKLGCLHCYQTFERQLSGLLERLHEGATHHVGKVPKRLLAASTRPSPSPPPAASADAPDQRPSPPPQPPPSSPPKIVVLTAAQAQRRVQSLKSKLEQAVALEQYEKAAQFRDELLKLQKLITQGQTAPSPASPPPPPEAAP
ncbi:MAG: UvrB/UvrC motif-containing protein [Phycisphaerales bacterium]|nr:UvrB/UvrC motif-containing protein [Phycisphaerales bacterium]